MALLKPVLFALTLSACTDEAEVCAASEFASTAPCEAALRFAIRYSDTIAVSQDLVDRYYAPWLRVIAAEPVLESRIPQTYRNVPWPGILVTVTDEQISSAWDAGHIETGVDYLDEVINQLTSPKIHAAYKPFYSLKVDAAYGEEPLAAALEAGGGATLQEPLIYPGDDGVWRWADEDAEVEFTISWGDCFVECLGYRHLKAIIPANSDARVYDLGGDPLPSHIVLAPTTTPQ